MVTIVFFILMLMIFGKLLIFGIKAAWGISKFLLTVVLLPVILIGLVIGGLFSIALPILLVIGVVSCSHPEFHKKRHDSRNLRGWFYGFICIGGSAS